MSVKKESVYTGEFLVSKGNNSISSEQVPLAANLAMESGTVVSKETASDPLKPLDPFAADGTETTAGILYAGKVTDASGGDGVIIAPLAEVVDSLLIWPAGITDVQKSANVYLLAGLDIILRTE